MIDIARPRSADEAVDPERRRAVLAKGYLPADVTPQNSDVAVYVNRFPLGDADNFSVARAAYAIAQSKQGSGTAFAWQKYAPWEKAYLDALAEVQFKAQGEQVSGLDGGYLAPEAWGDRLFDLLRGFSALDQLGITRVSVPARIAHLPKISGDITIVYPAENSQITSSQFSFGQMSYTAHRAIALYNESVEMFRDVPEVVDQALRLSASRAIANDRDTQLFIGVGDGPTGIVNVPQVALYYPGASASAAISSTPVHATPSLNHISQLRSKVTNLNASTLVTAGQAICDGIAVHSRFEQTVHTLGTAAGAWTDSQGRPLWLKGLNEDGGLLGTQWALTNVLPTNLVVAGGTASSYAIAGWWAQYVLFEAQSFTFDATPFGQGFGSNQMQVRVTYRYDGAPAHPEAFAVLAGVDQ